jgi:carbamoyltransferase
MLLVAPVREERRIAISAGQRELMKNDPDLCRRVNVPRSEVPAITHVDYSARLQTVDHQRNPRFYALLRAFYERTGCPVIVNTSFNVRGEPIVCTPAEALRCFLATDMDALIMEDIVVDKREAGTGLNTAAREKYRAEFALD